MREKSPERQNLPKNTIDLALMVKAEALAEGNESRAQYINRYAEKMANDFTVEYEKTLGPGEHEGRKITIYSTVPFGVYQPPIDPMDVVLNFYRKRKTTLRNCTVDQPTISKGKDSWFIRQTFTRNSRHKIG